MYLYVELWKPRLAWHALNTTRRHEFVTGIGPAVAGLLAGGVELLGFARNDTETRHRADYPWLALWRMPSKELAEGFEQAVIDYGFHDYFEQVNARGAVVDPAEILAEMERV